MKTLAFAAALIASTAAIAQTQPQQQQQQQQQPQPDPVGSQNNPPPEDQPAPAQPPEGDSGAPQQTEPSPAMPMPAQPSMGQMNSGAAPSREGPDAAAAMTPRPATTNYPPCSRTVTDNCIQRNERGTRRSRR